MRYTSPFHLGLADIEVLGLPLAFPPTPDYQPCRDDGTKPDEPRVLKGTETIHIDVNDALVVEVI